MFPDPDQMKKRGALGDLIRAQEAYEEPRTLPSRADKRGTNVASGITGYIKREKKLVIVLCPDENVNFDIVMWKMTPEENYRLNHYGRIFVESPKDLEGVYPEHTVFVPGWNDLEHDKLIWSIVFERTQSFHIIGGLFKAETSR
jgi:hypothetical protein